MLLIGDPQIEGNAAWEKKSGTQSTLLSKCYAQLAERVY
jgi:hypothetical protein